MTYRPAVQPKAGRIPTCHQHDGCAMADCWYDHNPLARALERIAAGTA